MVSAPPISSGADQRASTRYRADIDGLRAIAVLSIVAFHLGINRTPGGYVGVDVFFVISGYLIGGIILNEIRQNTYSVARFYVRRFRRIIPALVMMLIITTVAMWFIAFPGAMRDYGKSLVSAILSVSNFYFFSKSGYFDQSADTQPLLHTWSLALEEQYYLVFPIMMLFMRKVGDKRIRMTLIVVALLSLVASIVGVRFMRTATFYLLPTRFWELLLGALAVDVRLGRHGRRLIRELIAASGLLLVCGSILLYAPDTPFPGLAALPPCLGTAMLLVAGAHGKTWVGNLLSLRLAVFFGLISYSLYLWHWPIIVLVKAWLPASSLKGLLRAEAFLMSVALGWLSWRFVERPWRDAKITGRTIISATALSAIAVTALGVVLVAAAGVPSRFDPQVDRLAAFTNNSTSNDLRNGTCFISSAYRFADFEAPVCLHQNLTRTNILLMGDSHAAHLWSGLHTRFPDMNIMQATASGCKPFIKPRADDAPRCSEMMKFLFGDYLRRHQAQWIILAANWDQQDGAEAAATIDWMRERGLNVILSGPIVRYQVPLPQALALAAERHDATLVDRIRNADGRALDRQYAMIAHVHNISYISPYQALCGGATCLTTATDGMPLQFDYGHLTAPGSLLVANSFPLEAITRR